MANEDMPTLGSPVGCKQSGLAGAPVATVAGSSSPRLPGDQQILQNSARCSGIL